MNLDQVFSAVREKLHRKIDGENNPWDRKIKKYGNLRIESNGNPMCTRVFVDDVQLENVTAISFGHLTYDSNLSVSIEVELPAISIGGLVEIGRSDTEYHFES